MCPGIVRNLLQIWLMRKKRSRKPFKSRVVIRFGEDGLMSRSRTLIGGLALLIAAGGGTGCTQFVDTARAQEKTTVTPGRPIVYPRFEVEVLVDGRPLAEYESRGRTYVEALRGEEYEIRLRNRSNDW